MCGRSRAGRRHEVRLLDLQIFSTRDFARELTDYHPDAVGFSLNYLANVPEVIDVAKLARPVHPAGSIFPKPERNQMTTETGSNYSPHILASFGRVFLMPRKRRVEFPGAS